MTKFLESQFHDAMVDIYKRAKNECNYNAGQFIKMISNDGGLITAKKLLQSKEIQYGFTELWECGRLDLTVEAHVLMPEFITLFTETEIAEAKNRLESHDFYVVLQDNFTIEQGDDSTIARKKSNQYQVIYLENSETPLGQNKIEKTLNDMASKGWVFKQLSIGANNKTETNIYWVYIVFTKEGE